MDLKSFPLISDKLGTKSGRVTLYKKGKSFKVLFACFTVHDFATFCPLSTEWIFCAKKLQKRESNVPATR
jgi:hypothetical protein